jgi:phage terminase large subunit GpA-like protein
MGSPNGSSSMPSSESSFEARSYAITCPECDREFTFTLGWLLDYGVDPTTVRKAPVNCPHCHENLSVFPSDVRRLL